MNTEVIKIDTIDGWMIIIIMIYGSILGYAYNEATTPEKIPDLHCKEGKEIVPLELEQLTACYKGCQFATQPTFNITPIKTFGMRTYIYESCNMKCEEIYQ